MMNKMWIVPAAIGSMAAYGWAMHDPYPAWGGLLVMAIIASVAVHYAIKPLPKMKWFILTWECSQGIEHIENIAAWDWRQARERLLGMHDDVKDIIKVEEITA